MTPKPQPAPPAIAAFVGLYGVDRAILDIYEQNGELFADGSGLEHRPVAETSELTLHWQRGKPQALLGGQTLGQFDFMATTAAEFRQAISADLATLRTASLGKSLPWQYSEGRLVEIAAVDPSIAIDLRYASTNNFLGAPLYERAVALLAPPAAEALSRAQASLLSHGYRLLVLDAYRPWSVTWLFWQAIPVELRQYVADPAKGSKHNRGCAVDLTLLPTHGDLPVEMPSAFDEATLRADPDYRGGTSLARWHRDLLRTAMETAGFTVDPSEWWHYDFAGWQDCPVLNQPL